MTPVGDSNHTSITPVPKRGGFSRSVMRELVLRNLLKKESNYGNCRSYVFEEERDIMGKIIVNVNNHIALICHQLMNITCSLQL